MMQRPTIEMLEASASDGLLLLFAAVAVFCVVVALFAVLSGRNEEKLFAAVIASGAVLQIFVRSVFVTSDASFQSVEVGSCLVELTVAVVLALKTDRLWPLVIAAVFLVKTVAAIAISGGFEVGAFARQELQIAMRVLVALIVVRAIFQGRKSLGSRVINQFRLS